MNRLFSITVWTIIVVSIPVTLMTMAIFAFLDASVIGLSLLFAALYLGIVWWALSKTPLWPRFAKKSTTFSWAIASLLWGGFACMGMVMLFALPMMDLMEKLEWDLVAMSWAGAYPEEVAKAFGVVLILMAYRQLNRPWHGFATGALVGLGFEVIENLVYGATGALLDANADIDGVLMMWGYRSIAGPLIHTLLTAFAGYGIGLALFYANESKKWRIFTAAKWIFLAFALHFAWNIQWENPWYSIVTMVIVCIIMYGQAINIVHASWSVARDDVSYAYAPGIITSTKELALIDAPMHPQTPATGELEARPGAGENGESKEP
ncbi:hypothetical protein CDES_00955 [Corynebacterium deserti GIMN1.010]|uniref:Protease PrsW n=1 Tax=Corynebacterium deserti GIMN1.010 TaxID=931089 RepID=A0A0M4CGI9_9CORY|nr:PrsW family intramembrane metalloprotease [Corynebacterium deserti]ALC04671.1 hypothetical protein CDES_00955 [Corynebacterium deserti GIMN1.010]